MNKIRFKKMMVASLAAITLVTSVYSVGAMTLFYSSKGRRGLNIYVEANTTSGVLTPANASHDAPGLKSNKYVKKVKIRLVEGDYDQSKSTTSGFVSLEKWNNPFQKSSGKVKWYYKK